MSEIKAKECTLNKTSECEFKNCYGHYLTRKIGHCEYIPNKHCPYELTKQIQKAKEENTIALDALEKILKKCKESVYFKDPYIEEMAQQAISKINSIKGEKEE